MTYKTPETERTDFTSQYEEALRQSRKIEAGEIKKLIVDMIEDPDTEATDKQIVSVFEFVREAIRNTDIPTSWLMEDFYEINERIETENLYHNLQEAAFQRLLRLNKIDLNVDFENDLNQKQQELLNRMIIKTLQVNLEFYGVTEILYLKINIKHEYGNYTVHFEVELKDGSAIGGSFNGDMLMRIVKEV
jgi:hypothetical protein